MSFEVQSVNLYFAEKLHTKKIDKNIGTSADGPLPYWTPISWLSLQCPLKADGKKEDKKN
jgi:hypothetical protein